MHQVKHDNKECDNADLVKKIFIKKKQVKQL